MKGEDYPFILRRNGPLEQLINFTNTILKFKKYKLFLFEI
jgi:hypothetical protein